MIDRSDTRAAYRANGDAATSAPSVEAMHVIPTSALPGPVDTTAVPAAEGLVVAIAATAPDRLRIAASVGDKLSLLMVSSVEEALVLLAGLPSSAQQAPSFDVLSAADPPPPLQAVQTIRPLESDVLAIDSDERVLVFRDRTVDLTPLEHDVMECLLQEVGRTWPYAALHRRVWGSDHHRGRADVHSVVKRLRHKLSSIDSPLHLDVVRGVGLRLLPERASPA